MPQKSGTEANMVLLKNRVVVAISNVLFALSYPSGIFAEKEI